MNAYKLGFYSLGLCKNGDVRLVNSQREATLRGHVEVCLDQQWTSVCDTSWTQQDATVVCKQLGYGQATNLGTTNTMLAVQNP